MILGHLENSRIDSVKNLAKPPNDLVAFKGHFFIGMTNKTRYGSKKAVATVFA